MAETMSWKSVELGEGLPQLLVKTSLDKDGYEIQLTDLSRIWGERLGKNEIMDRAGEGGCSIDPSEDDQYQILLDKIGSALNGDNGTTLDIHSQGDALQLDVSAPLPGSLPTFRWTINLVRMQDSTVGTELVTPLLAQATQLRQQIQQLVDELASKDRVIAKTTDRLEISGNDLTAVFPGASNIKTSRKKSQRAQLAKYVEGLADFDESVWRASLKHNAGPVDLFSDVLNNALRDLPAPETTADTGEWWTDLQNPASEGAHGNVKNEKSQKSQTSVRPRSQISNGINQNQPPMPIAESMQDDEFQRQGPPPPLKVNQHVPDDEDAETDATSDEAPKTQIPETIEDEETDDDLGAAPSRTSSSQTKGCSQQQESNTSSSHAPPAAPRKLGVLGGRKSKSPQPEPQAEVETEDDEVTEPKPRRKGKLGAFGGKKKTVSPEPVPVPEPPAEEPIPQQTAKPKAKLDGFGGKAKAATPSEPASSEMQEPKPKLKLGTFGGKGKGSSDTAPVKAEANEEGKPPSPAKARLGRMGGKVGSKGGTMPQAEPDLEAERQSRAPEKTGEEPEQERENSQESADKKREKLKRELEEKAKGPVKKKRKF